VQTTTGSLTSGSTSLTIAGSFAGWPSSFPFFGVLELGSGNDEVVSVTGIAGTTATIVRGQDGSTAVSHPSGATFNHVFVRQDFDEANAHTSATSGVHGASGSVVGTTDSQTLTNKTLTNPIINGGTLTGATFNNLTASGDSSHSAVTGSATTVGGKLFSGKNSSAVEKFSVSDAGNVVAGGTLASTGCSSTGPVSGTTGAFSGAVTGASFAASGALSGASAAVTGAATAASYTATGAVAGASIVASGTAGTVSGVLLPKVFATTAARDTAIPSPTAGEMCYITAELRLHVYNGSAWVGQAVVKHYSGTTDVNGDLTVTHNLGFTPVAVVPAPNSPVRGAGSASILVALLADDASFGATTFRVRAINDAGSGSAQMASTAITFSAVCN
jgi:hypothetical protein